MRCGVFLHILLFPCQIKIKAVKWFLTDRNCFFKKVVNWIGKIFKSSNKKMREKHLIEIKENKHFFSGKKLMNGFVHTCKNCLKIICFYKSYILFN